MRRAIRRGTTGAARAIERVREGGSIAVPPGHPAQLPCDMLATALGQDMYGSAAEALSPAAEIRWPSNRIGYGRGYWIGCLTQIRSSLHDPAFTIDHVAARPLPRDDIAVAVRWSLAGTHAGAGAWGEPTGRDLLIMGISHYRLRASAIIEDTTVFDELAVLRQVAGGLGA